LLRGGSKARKFRTWTFSAEALFTRQMREGGRVNCYAEVAKHASSARGLSPERRDFTHGLRSPAPARATAGGPGCLPGGCSCYVALVLRSELLHRVVSYFAEQQRRTGDDSICRTLDAVQRRWQALLPP
jgi:hypothetical protein